MLFTTYSTSNLPSPLTSPTVISSTLGGAPVPKRDHCAAVRTPAPGFLNQESPTTTSVQLSPSKSADPPDAHERYPVPTVCFTQWSGAQYSHHNIGAFGLDDPLQSTSRCPEVKS
jgi:hypothetical protein